jgi:beta-lactamase superfamily II metal-dependent hydrolase
VAGIEVPQKSKLRLTMIDVGMGDSLLLESIDATSVSRYALVDSNDTTNFRSSYIFLKRFFEKRQETVPAASALFEWVLMTHAHADHGAGLQRILKDFGTKYFWHSTSPKYPVLIAKLLKYAQRSNQIANYESIDTSVVLPPFGNATMEVLWPEPGVLDANENNNSVVLAITLGKVTFVLTGDAEADVVWTNISSKIPQTTQFFKVPHHGATNGMFTSGNASPWLSALPQKASLGISSHILPYSHPDQKVLNALTGKSLYRTDLHYHICVETDGVGVKVSYSHV